MPDQALKRWDQPVSVTVELVFTGKGMVMSSRELAHLMFHQIHQNPMRWNLQRDEGQASTVELLVARPLCEGEGCEWHDG